MGTMADILARKEVLKTERFSRIARVIADFDPNLRLLYIPGEHQSVITKPFAVGEYRENYEPYIIMYLDESEVNETLIARLFAMRDATSNLNTWADKIDEARRVLDLKAKMEKAEERIDAAKTIFNSPLHTYKINGRTYHG